MLVLPSLAVAVGLNEAIILQQIHYWLGASKNSHDGRLWVYNTYEQWAEQFPFWSPEFIRKIVKSLRDKNLIEARQLSPNAWDKTNSYTINYEALESAHAGGLDAVNLTASKRKNPPHLSGEKEAIHAVKSTASKRANRPHLNTETTSKTTTETTISPVAVAPVAGPVFPPIDDAVVKQAKPAPVGTVAVVEAAEVVEHTPTAKPKATKPAGDKTAVAAVACPSDVDAAVFADFLAIRKAKRAPLTATALGGIRREADKAGVTLEEALTVCCERGWVGFRADWHHEGAVTNVRAGGTLNKQEALEARNRAVAAQWVADMQAKMNAQGGVL